MKLKIRFINIALSLLLFCVGFLSVSSRAYAYDAEDNFYPIVNESSYLSIYQNGFSSDDRTIYQSVIRNNKHYFSNPIVENVVQLSWEIASNDPLVFDFPYNPDIYDYYFLGNISAFNTDVAMSTFKPTAIGLFGKDYATNMPESYPLSDVVFYDIDNTYYSGFGWYAKVDFQSCDNIGLSYIFFSNDKDLSGNKPANLVLDMGILAVGKGQNETAVMSQILNQLQNMENSINSSIGSAADQVTGSIDSASNSITSKLEESFDSLTSNLTEWFDDVFNGYSGSNTDQASDNFDTSAGELHTTETQLTDITNSSVTNYTEFAFNTNVLTTLGASLVYVVTWFTNFWDIGGLFTAVLNIGLALFVAFFILRLRGDP